MRCGLLKGGISTRKRRTYPKANIIVDCDSHIILGLVPGRGPTSDSPVLSAAMDTIPGNVRMARLLGDAGYDSEDNHRLLREQHGIKSLIALNLRPGQNIKGKYRRLMQRVFTAGSRHYKRRYQIETVISMIKRLFGCAVAARKTFYQNCEIFLKAFTLNLSLTANL